MKLTGNKRSHTLSAFAALLLFVQSALVAWSAGAMPIGPMLDQFGNPLCITSGEHDAPLQHHGKVPSCCTIGCMTAPALQVGPPTEPFYLIEIPNHVASNWPAIDLHAARPQFRQNGPRAPPMTVPTIII